MTREVGVKQIGPNWKQWKHYTITVCGILKLQGPGKMYVRVLIIKGLPVKIKPPRKIHESCASSVAAG